MSDLNNSPDVATDGQGGNGLPNDVKAKAEGLNDDMLNFVADQYAKKRKANEEAMQYRKQLEEYQSQLEAKEAEIKAKYDAELAQWETKYNELHNEMRAKKAEKAKAEFDLAVAKHKAKDAEVVESLLSRHLSSIKEDKDALNAFNVNEWMSKLTEEKSFLFDSGTTTTTPASFGAGAGNSANESGLKPNDRNSITAKDREEVLSDWAEFDKTLSGVDNM